MSFIKLPASHSSSSTIPNLRAYNSISSESHKIAKDDVSKSSTDPHFKVYIKVKSQGKSETKTTGNPSYLTLQDEHSIYMSDATTRVAQNYRFEYVFNERSNQKKLFRLTTLPLIEKSLLGNNAAVFLYGRPCSGKTHTLGVFDNIDEDSQGIVPASLKYIFDAIEKIKARQGNNYNWKLSLSITEVNSDGINDLLRPLDNSNLDSTSNLRGSHKKPLTLLQIETHKQALVLINATLLALNQRSQGNIIYTFRLKQQFMDASKKEIVSHFSVKLVSKFAIVDLACPRGSTSSTSDVLQMTLKDPSLRALNKVIISLRDQPESSIPYGTSLLTNSLKDVLIKDTYISFIATISSSLDRMNETISTLELAYQYQVSIANIKEKHSQSNLHLETLKKKIPAIKRTPSNNSQQEIEGSIQELDKGLDVVKEEAKTEELNRSFKSLGDKKLLECLFEVIVEIKKVLLDKTSEIFLQKETLMSEMIESFRKELEKNKNDMGKDDAEFFLKRHEILEEKKFPLYPSELPKDEEDIDENLLSNQPLENAIDEVKKVFYNATTFIMESIESLANNSINLEKLKIEFLSEEMKKIQAEDETDQMSKLVYGLYRYNNTLYSEIISLKCPNISSTKKSEIFDDHNKKLVAILTEFIPKEDEALHPALEKVLVSPPLEEPENSPVINKFGIINIEGNFSFAPNRKEVSTQTLPKSTSYNVGTETDHQEVIANIHHKIETKSVHVQTSPFEAKTKDNNEGTVTGTHEGTKSPDFKIKIPHKLSFGFEEISFRNRGWSYKTSKTLKSNSSVKEKDNNASLVEESERGSDSDLKSLMEEKLVSRDTSDFLKDENHLRLSFGRDDEEENKRETSQLSKEIDLSEVKPRIYLKKPITPIQKTRRTINFQGLDTINGEFKLSDQASITDPGNQSNEKILAGNDEVGVKNNTNDNNEEADADSEDLSSIKKGSETAISVDKHMFSYIPNMDSSNLRNSPELDKDSKKTFSCPISPNLDAKSTKSIREINMPSLDSNSTREIPELKKLSTNRFKNFGLKPLTPEKKILKGQPTQASSIVDSLSPEKLSEGIEKMNPTKLALETPSSIPEKLDKSGEQEGSPSRLKVIYEEEGERDAYVEYLLDAYKSRKRSPISEYKVKNKIIKFGDRPLLPKLVKLMENLTPKRKIGNRDGSRKDRSNRSNRSYRSYIRDKSSDRSKSSIRDERSGERSKSNSIKGSSWKLGSLLN